MNLNAVSAARLRKSQSKCSMTRQNSASVCVMWDVEVVRKGISVQRGD